MLLRASPRGGSIRQEDHGGQGAMCGSMLVSIFYAGIGCYIAASCERLLIVTAPMCQWIKRFNSAGFVITTRETPCADPRAHRHINRGGLLWLRAGMSPRSVVAATPHERMVHASRCAFVPAACIGLHHRCADNMLCQ